jgi:hypothetical protein
MLIPIIIPTGYTYSCTVSGSSFKIVQCEHCRFVYVYKMTRTGSGASSASIFSDGGDAAHAAESTAQYELTRKLHDDCDAVPCLECGKLQEHMVEALRRDFWSGPRYCAWFAIGTGAVAAVLYLLELSTWFGWLALGLIGLGTALLLSRRHLLKEFDPNRTDVAERLKTARTYGRSLDEFRQILANEGIQLELPNTTQLTL